MSLRCNVLWIQTDEQRPDTLGCYGSTWAKTPHLDALAASGVTMTRTFCQSPVCCPSRTSQLACRYPAELNILSNIGGHRSPDHSDLPNLLPSDTAMFPEVFAQAGYVTASIGKTHTPWHPTTWMHNDDLTLFPEHATYTALGSDHDPRDCRIIHRPGSHPIIISGRYPEGCKPPAEEITDRSLAFLGEGRGDQPFLLRISHNYPHTPVLPPRSFEHLYDDADIPVRYFDRSVYENRSGWDRSLADRDRMDQLTPEQQRRVWYDYMTLAAYVDSEIGRVLEYLDQAGLRENTIILFSSDHGRALGEWGAGEKCMFDDQVWRVPMIWNFPSKLPSGTRRDDLCELLDTGPTLLNLAGLGDQVPDAFRGRDLFGDAPHPQAVFGQIGWPNLHGQTLGADEVTQYAKAFNGEIPAYNSPMRLAVRTARYRMDVSWMEEGQRLDQRDLDGNLFDLEQDPHETRNLWDDPTVAQEQARLLALIEDYYQHLTLDPRLT